MLLMFKTTGIHTPAVTVTSRKESTETLRRLRTTGVSSLVPTDTRLPAQTLAHEATAEHLRNARPEDREAWLHTAEDVGKPAHFR